MRLNVVGNSSSSSDFLGACPLACCRGRSVHASHGKVASLAFAQCKSNIVNVFSFEYVYRRKDCLHVDLPRRELHQ